MKTIKQISASNNNHEVFKYLLIFSPLILLVIQSYVKLTIIESMSNILRRDAGAIYWLIRAVLFLGFFILIFTLTPNINFNLLSGQKTNDFYEDIRKNQDPLLGLRAFACLSVFFGHWFLVIFNPYAPPKTTIEYIGRAALSFSPWAGIWIFFTLSGYLIGKGFVSGRHNITRDGIKRFYKNRILRIFPVYFASIIIVFVLFRTSVLVKPGYIDFGDKSALYQIFLDALFFDQSGGGFIGVLWSVSTEFQFYLLAPLIYLLLAVFCKSDKKLIFFSLTIVLAFAETKFWILRHYPGLWHARIYLPLMLNLDCFLCGFVTSFLVQCFREKKIYLNYGMDLGFMAMALLYLIMTTWSYPEMMAFPGLPGSSTRIYFLSFAPGAISVMASLVIFLSTRSENPGLLRPGMNGRL